MKHDTLFDLIRGLLCLNVAGIYASFDKGSKNIILAFNSDPIDSKKNTQLIRSSILILKILGTILRFKMLKNYDYLIENTGIKITPQPWSTKYNMKADH